MIKSQWVAVRKYSSPEPTTTVGQEEAYEARLHIDPSLVQKTLSDIGTYFNVSVKIDSITDLFGFDCNVTWDNTLVTFSNCYFNKTLDAMWGAGNWFVAQNETGAGWYKLVAVSTVSGFSTTGSQTMFTIEFRVEDPQTNLLKQTSIHFLTHKLSDSHYTSITHTVDDGTYKITGGQPGLQMSPTTRTCRVHNENFVITITVTNAYDVNGFEFEIDYNTTLLDCTGVVWTAWVSGTSNIDDTNGKITGTASGNSISGSQTLMTVQFSAAYYRVWKEESKIPGWKNDQIGQIFFQSANLSYSGGGKLHYVKDAMNEITVSSSVTCTFSPIQGDVENNGVVDVFDLRTVAAFYDTKLGDPNCHKPQRTI